jgi:hypothetical protein
MPCHVADTHEPFGLFPDEAERLHHGGIVDRERVRGAPLHDAFRQDQLKQRTAKSVAGTQ